MKITPRLYYQKRLIEYTKSQIKFWIKNAIFAFSECRENEHYKISKDEQGMCVIKPIDYQNTGMTQSGMHWSDGLHQFLQIKHGLASTPESLVTNYLSNHAYLKRYQDEQGQQRIFGLTGTLGSVASCQLLNKLFTMDFIKIPTIMPRRFTLLAGLIQPSEATWMTALINACAREQAAGRAILVLCETERVAEKIKEALSLNLAPGFPLIPYIDSETNQVFALSKPLQAKTIVVSTNLAGRATNILLAPNVVNAGGLHTIFSFLPKNRRVEQQGLNRGARRNEPGTGELILCEDDIENKLASYAKLSKAARAKLTLDNIREWRDEAEEASLSVFETQDFPRIEQKDEMFKAILKKRNEYFRDGKKLVKKHSIMRTSIDETNQTERQALQQELKEANKKAFAGIQQDAFDERWGLWLKENERLDVEERKVSFDNFLKAMEVAYEEDTLIDRATHFIKFGNQVLSDNAWFLSIKEKVGSKINKSWSPYLLARDAYREAIRRDQQFAFQAYYYLAVVIVRRGEKPNYKNPALQLKRAKEIYMNAPRKTSTCFSCLNEKSNRTIKAAPYMR